VDDAKDVVRVLRRQFIRMQDLGLCV
jgi:hypothetical protein